MRFFYPNASLPSIEKKMLLDIDNAASRLCEKLNHLSVDLLCISDYNKRYLNAHRENIQGTLQKYSYLLSWSIASIDVPLDEFIFIDYGGGSGVLSLLAKEFGIGKVIYNDIYDVSCADAKVIGQALQNEADYYVQGDLDVLIDFLKANSICCHAMASYDVIEHIYDIERLV